MTVGTVNLGLVDGQPFSAANLDSLEAYISAGGDYGAGAPTGTGSNGQSYYDTTNSRLWRSNGSAWKFVAAYDTTKRPGVILTDASQSIPSGGADVTWGTEVSDVDGWTSGGSATLTVPTGWGGRYLISYTGEWTAGATHDYFGIILIISSGGNASCSSRVPNYPEVTCLRSLSAGDTIKASAYQATGGAVGLISRMEIAWIGA